MKKRKVGDSTGDKLVLRSPFSILCRHSPCYDSTLTRVPSSSSWQHSPEKVTSVTHIACDTSSESLVTLWQSSLDPRGTISKVLSCFLLSLSLQHPFSSSEVLVAFYLARFTAFTTYFSQGIFTACLILSFVLSMALQTL